ncbi:unnamed protein product [Prunus armeniaca]
MSNCHTSLDMSRSAEEVLSTLELSLNLLTSLSSSANDVNFATKFAKAWVLWQPSAGRGGHTDSIR